MGKKKMFMRHADNIDLESGIVCYYKMNGNTDDSIGSHNGSPSNITYVSGKVDQCASFNGSSSYITIPDDDELSFTDDNVNDLPFTVIAGVYLNNITASQIILNKRNDPTNLEYHFSIDGVDFSNTMTFRLINTSSTDQIRIRYPLSHLNSGQWYHVVIRHDGSKSANGFRMNLNGVEVTSLCDLSEAGVYVGSINGTSQLVLGKAAWTSAYHLDGRLDEVAIIRGREYSDKECLNAYNRFNLGLPLVD